MKKKSILRVILCFCLVFSSLWGGNKTFAQEKNVMLTTYNAIIYTSNFAEGRQRIVEFVKNTSSVLSSQNESERKIEIVFYVSEKTFQALDSIAGKCGYVSEKDVNTSSEEIGESSFNLKKEYLENRKKAYLTEFEKMSMKDERYYNYFEEMRKIDKELSELQLDMLDNNQISNYKASFTIYDETKDYTQDRISWVNMPGASFTQLYTETPEKGISTGLYQGYALKYMVTRGKSYFNLGALKNQESFDVTSKEDSSTFTELFFFGFGQDWYSKHFGRGRRKCFNLYTGYDFGGIFATGKAIKKSFLYCNVFLGVELLKTKHILIDTKAGYFVPFYQNRNLRGVIWSGSFNFVF